MNAHLATLASETSWPDALILIALIIAGAAVLIWGDLW